MIKNLPQIVLLNIVGLALFLSWYIPINHGFWLPIDADIFISLIRNWSKVRPFVAGCIDQQSRFRRLFTAGDGNVDAEFLAERKRPRQTTYRDYWSGHAINCSGIKPAGSGINSCKTGQSNVDFYQY